MKMLLIVTAAAALVGAQPALAKGCIRGAAAGGIAGHYVGKGHGVMGAAAGCIAMHHHYAKQARAEKAAAKN
jgi:outer membrane lipoprotein SlyB